MVAFTSLSVENFAAFQRPLEWGPLASLNVVIGENDTGKTHLLKLLYAMARAVADYGVKRSGPEPKDLAELLAHKLRWTFLPPKLELGKLVSPGLGNRLSANLCWGNDGHLRFAFGKATTTQIVEISTDNLSQLLGNKASFLPPKEILSIFDAIVATRETLELAAFDDTYYDLVRDFRQPTASGKLQANIKTALVQLEQVTGGGEVEMENDGNIVFRRGKEVFNMHQTAEGIRKVGILSRLMRNRRLTPAGGCMLFVDEPEVNLHPKAIVVFAEMLHEFAQSGIQVFLTTHSYYLLKRLEQLARQHQTDYSLLDLRKQEGVGVVGTVSRLANGLPDNPIAAESMKLFDFDVLLDFA